ncbi:MAG: rRNA pseudouridine synthase [Lentisphaerae bacterium]|nr:rRNA pseudouridine synthase [Lentisphaerota bacterium]
MSEVRLHKFLSECGVGSRRACEALIAAGRVTVDGEVVTRLGTCIAPAARRVQVDGRPVRPEGKVVLLFNKPRDVLCTAHDPRGRLTFAHFFSFLGRRVFTVGRLDRYSEGLLIVTNDGELAHTLMHPRFEIKKIYRVWIEGRLTPGEKTRMAQGVVSEGETLRVESVTEVEAPGARDQYELVLREGRNRHVRRLLAALGRPVKRLKRIGIGPLRLNGIGPGKWRPVSEQELAVLRHLADTGNGAAAHEASVPSPS